MSKLFIHVPFIMCPSHLHTSQASQAQQLQGMCPAEAPPEGTQGGAIDHHVAAKALMGWEVKTTTFMKIVE